MQKPIEPTINWYEVCQSVPIGVKKHYWCNNYTENIKLGTLSMCKHNRDL